LICRSSSGVTERILSKINFPFSTMQWKKTPPKVTSRYSTDYIPNPCTKCCINIGSGIVNSGPDKASWLYLDQATPKLSPSFWAKLRTSLKRSIILDNGKKAKHNWSFKITQLPWQLLTWSLYHYFAHPISENGKAFHLSVSRFIPDIMRVAHISSKTCRCLYGFSSKPPAKFYSPTKDMKSGRISYNSALIGCDEVAGSRYFPFRDEKL
jgi:hypothetical protein